jgi:ligand-binding sensor domain-containing protein/two-component sensor histidine kinase
MQTLRFLIFCVIAVSGLCAAGEPPARGLDPAREISHYAHRAWTKRDGLPQNTVEAIAQTPDGYLWFGTVEGLVRFDGSSFRVFNVRNTPQLGMNYLSALCVTRDSSLYIGTYGGGVLRMRDGVFRRVPPPKGFEHVMIRRMREDSKGNLWVATTNGLWLVRGDSIQRVFTVADGLPLNVVITTCETPDGHIFVATAAGIWVSNGDCFEPWMRGLAAKAVIPYDYTFAQKQSLESVPTDLLCDGNGSLWIATRTRGLFRFSGGMLSSYDNVNGLKQPWIQRLYRDQRGTIWIGTMGHGLWRFANGVFSGYTTEDGLSSDEIMSMFEDREGNLWVGTSSAGVNRFTNSPFTTFRVGSTVVENMVWSVGEGPGGKTYASTASGKVFVLEGSRFRLDPLLSAKHNGIVATYLHDSRGTFWLGGSDGLVRMSGGKAARIVPYGVTSLAEDRLGRIWVAGVQGVGIIDSGTVVPLCFGSLKAQYDVRQILLDARDRIYLVTQANGLLWFPLRALGRNGLDTTLVHWSNLGDGNAPPWVVGAMIDHRETLWITTIGGGLRVLRGDSVRTLTPADGLPEEVMYTGITDQDGGMWFSSNNGVYRARVTDLYALLDNTLRHVPFESFGISDGMYSDECNGGHQASALRSRDGRLWFPTTAGVVMVDPNRMPVNAVPPAVVIERMLVDNVEGVTRSSAGYPPGNGDLEFHFMGMSYGAPERVRYRYLLEGFNKQWIDAGDRHDAFYTNIPPGTYRFRVQAVNGSGTWNLDGATVAFTLRPHFYQTHWFILLIGTGIIGTVLLGMYMYKGYRDREVIASQLESELARAQVQILEMQLQPHFLFNTLNSIMVLIRQEPDLASQMVARLSEFLRLTLDSAGMQEVTLRRELEFLEKYLHIERIRFGDRLQIEQHVDPAVLDALVPNLLLQPIVENAIRHGVARKRGPAMIALSAGRSNGAVTLHVRDNGVGLPTRNGGGMKEGIGIRNTRQRLQHLYGNEFTFILDSPPEGGVDVVLTLPFHNGSL